MINLQPPEKPEYHDDGSLDVIDVWHTIQGEGPFAGTPAVFIRLAGCNLQCRGCDTQYTDGRQRFKIGALYERLVYVSNPTTRLVVLTGGEPFRQNLTPFVRAVAGNWMKVQIETNGTLWDPKFPYNNASVDIVCSPKTPSVHQLLQVYVHSYKYILESGQMDPTDGLPTSVLGLPISPFRPTKQAVREGRVFVQPMDEDDPDKNAANVRAAVESAMTYGYRISLQTHKILGVP